jgi:peptidoglycan/LPS O-acetylase OafA/YrhL
MLAAFAFVALRRRAKPVSPHVATMGALVAAAAVFAAFVAAETIGRAAGDDGVHRWLNAWRVGFGPVLAIATLGIALGAPGLRGLAGARPFAWLSVVSYNAYLWNLEIAVGLHAAGLPPWAVFWFGGAATLAVAVLVTYFFERPIQRLGVREAVARVRRSVWGAVPRPTALPGGTGVSRGGFSRLVP